MLSVHCRLAVGTLADARLMLALLIDGSADGPVATQPGAGSLAGVLSDISGVKIAPAPGSTSAELGLVVVVVCGAADPRFVRVPLFVGGASCSAKKVSPAKHDFLWPRLELRLLPLRLLSRRPRGLEFARSLPSWEHDRSTCVPSAFLFRSREGPRRVASRIFSARPFVARGLPRIVGGASCSHCSPEPSAKHERFRRSMPPTAFFDISRHFSAGAIFFSLRVEGLKMRRLVSFDGSSAALSDTAASAASSGLSLPRRQTTSTMQSRPTPQTAPTMAIIGEPPESEAVRNATGSGGVVGVFVGGSGTGGLRGDGGGGNGGGGDGAGMMGKSTTCLIWGATSTLSPRDSIVATVCGIVKLTSVATGWTLVITTSMRTLATDRLSCTDSRLTPAAVAKVSTMIWRSDSVMSEMSPPTTSETVVMYKASPQRAPGSSGGNDGGSRGGGGGSTGGGSSGSGGDSGGSGGLA
mmetsp:Transcript_26899/g.78666  ORF Transcript_26899/g.78666 Transcript_26899/m.78666 type:complete len:467 (+) Transcript_26899:302-1702(+)